MVLQTVLTTTVPVQSKQPTCREAIPKYSTTQANPENKIKQLTKEFNQNMSSLEIAQSKQPHSNSFKSQQTNIRRTFEMVGRALDPQRKISRKEYDEMLRKMLLTAKRLKLASSSNVSGKNGATSSKAEIPVNKQKSCSDSASLRVKSSRKLGNLNQNLRRAQLAQQHSKLRASSAQSTPRISGTSVRNLDLLKVNFSQKISKTTSKRQLSSSSNLSSKMEVPSRKQKLYSDLSSSKVKSPPEKPRNLTRNLSYLRRAQLAQQHSKLRAGSAQSTSRISGTFVRNLDHLKVNFSQKTTKTTAKRQLPSSSNLSSKMEVPSKKQKLDSGSPSSKLESPTKNRNGRNQIKTKKIFSEEHPMILRLPKFALEEGFLKFPSSSTKTSSSKPASDSLLKAPSSENFLPELPPGISLTPVKRELTTASEGIVLDISKKQHIDHALSKNESTVEESKKRVSSPASSKTFPPFSRLESPTEKQNSRNQVKTKKIPSEELPNFALEEGFLNIPSSSTMTSSSKPASAPLLKAPSSDNFLPKLPSGISLTPVRRELATTSEGIVLDISKKQHIDHALSKNESTVEESKKRVSSSSRSKTSYSSNNIPTFTTWRDLQATKSDCSKSESGFSQHLRPQVSKYSKEPSSMPKNNKGLSKSSQSNPKTASSTPKISASDLNKDPVQSKQPRSREAIPKLSTTRAYPVNKMEELTKEFNQNMSRLEIAQSKQLHSNSFKSQQTNIQRTFDMKERSLDPPQNISQKQNDEMLRNMSFSDTLQVNFSQKKSKTTGKSQLPSSSNLSSKMEVPSKKQKLYSGSPSSRLESPTEKQNGPNQVKTKKIPSEELPNLALEEGFLKIPSSSTMTSSSTLASVSLLKAPSSENFLPKLPSGISLTPIKRELTTSSEGIVLDISKKQHIDHALSKKESTVEESKKRVSSPSTSKTSYSSENIPTSTTWRDLQATKSDCSKSESGLSQHLKPQVSKRSKEPSSMPKDNKGLSKSSQSNPKTASSAPKIFASDLNKVNQKKPDDILLNSMYSAAKQEESTSNPTSVNKSSAAAASPSRQGGFYFPFL